MSQLLACGPTLLARPSNEMNPGPAHVQDMAHVRAQEAVTALGSLVAVRQPATTEATRCGGTGGYIMRTTTGGRLTWSWGLRLTKRSVDDEVGGGREAAVSLNGGGAPVTFDGSRRVL
jgi:hypothetical protein